MTDEDRTKFRLDALNLAYGILLQQHASRAPGISNQAPTTEKVVEEASKLIDFIKVP